MSDVWAEWRALEAARVCGYSRCGHHVSKHTIGLTVWYERMAQCDDCKADERAGDKWHAFEPVRP